MIYPFFSIIIPCYNHAHFLELAISSVISQNFDRWEIIIVNDGSLDNTRQIADNWVQQDFRINVIHQENQGLSAARNTGINNARGQWLNFMDADDLLQPDCLSTIFSSIAKSNLPLDILQTAYDLIDDDGKLIVKKMVHVNNDSVFSNIKNGNPGPPLSFFVNRTMINRVGNFDISLKSAEDWDFWHRVAKLNCKAAIVNETLVAYRHTTGSMSRNPWRMYENILTVWHRINGTETNVVLNDNLYNKKSFSDYTFVKQNLIQCLALDIMQEQFQSAFEKFQVESKKYGFIYKPSDFCKMNSYLTFRYWYRKNDVINILTNYPTIFKIFFSKTQFSVQFIELSLFNIFKSHYKAMYQYKWGLFGNFIFQTHAFRMRMIKETIEKGY